MLEKKNRAGRGRFYAERYVEGREFNQAILDAIVKSSDLGREIEVKLPEIA